MRARQRWHIKVKDSISRKVLLDEEHYIDVPGRTPEIIIDNLHTYNEHKGWPAIGKITIDIQVSKAR